MGHKVYNTHLGPFHCKNSKENTMRKKYPISVASESKPSSPSLPMAMSGAASNPMDDDQINQRIVQFRAITSASREEAIFFLESHNWDVDSAVQSFYDDPAVEQEDNAEVQGDDAEEDDVEKEPAVEEEGEVDSDDDDDYLPSENEHDKVKKKKKKEEKEKGNKRSGISTISDLKRKSHSDSDSDPDSDFDSDSDGQDYYTGGEKRDPSKRRKINNAKAMIDQAIKMGTKAGPSKTKKSGSKSFKGKGRTLAGQETPSSPSSSPSYNIYLWRNGFTVNNGPLRSFSDPHNASFLESIKKSECPNELKPSDGSSEIGVNIIRKDTNYPLPKIRSKQNGAFRGKGRTIAEEGPSEDNSSPVPDAPPIVSSTDTPPVQLEASLPTTSLQIRLTDGTRLVSRFNTSSTIGDIRAFIDASRPGGTNMAYRLQTVGFPPKQLDDASKTIEEEGIANSVVIQKI